MSPSPLCDLPAVPFAPFTPYLTFPPPPPPPPVPTPFVPVPVEPEFPTGPPPRHHTEIPSWVLPLVLGSSGGICLVLVAFAAFRWRRVVAARAAAAPQAAPLIMAGQASPVDSGPAVYGAV